MSVTHLTFGSKAILLTEPFVPTEGDDGEFVGRAEELRLLLTGWIARPGKPPFAPLLIGEPGVGKTRLAYHAARLSNRDLYVFSGNDDVTAQELAVSVVSSGDSENLSFEYVLSPLATAISASSGWMFVP